MKYQVDDFAMGFELSHHQFYNFQYPLHFHRAMEFIYVRQGTLILLEPQKETLVQAGESLLFLPNTIHGFKSNPDTIFDAIVFSPNWVGSFLNDTKEQFPTSYLFKLSLVPLDFQKLLVNPYTTKGFLYLLCGEYQQQVTWTSKMQKNQQLTEKVIHFIGTHFREDKTIHDLAASLGYSHHYLAHFIADNMQTTFQRYMRNMRLTYAVDLLLTTDDTISSIVDQSGFTSVRSFNTAFKQLFLVSPSVYRKKHRP